MAESLYHETVGRLTLDGFQKEWYGQGNIYKNYFNEHYASKDSFKRRK